MKKVRIGNTIQWECGTIEYIVKDIQIGRECPLGDTGELLLGWFGSADSQFSVWCYSYNKINEYIKSGDLILKSTGFSPSQRLKKHKLT